jgi:hypothetical protein
MNDDRKEMPGFVLPGYLEVTDTNLRFENILSLWNQIIQDSPLLNSVKGRYMLAPSVCPSKQTYWK